MCYKYTDREINLEAILFISGKSILEISKLLKIPSSTISWHLIHPLKKINYTAWLTIRYKLLRRAKNTDRLIDETNEIYASGMIDFIVAEWDSRLNSK